MLGSEFYSTGHLLAARTGCGWSQRQIYVAFASMEQSLISSVVVVVVGRIHVAGKVGAAVQQTKQNMLE